MHLYLGLYRLVLLRRTEAEELRHLPEAACLLLLLDKLPVVFVLNNFYLLGLAFHRGALTRVFLGLADDLATVLLGYLQLHHFLYLVCLVFAVFLATAYADTTILL